jgi:hypothetical protein
MSGHFFAAGTWGLAAGKKMIFLGSIQSAMVDQAKGSPSLSLPGPKRENILSKTAEN